MRPALLGALLLALSGCASSHGSVTVSATGRIGPLHLDRSDRDNVIAFAGRPDAERDGEEFDSVPYRALGYDCSEKSVPERWPLLRRGPYCRTVYFINTRKGKLGTFFTSSSDYVERHGVRVGMRSAVAERRLHKHLTAGCEENLYLESRAAALTVAFSGGVTHVTTLDLAGGA